MKSDKKLMKVWIWLITSSTCLNWFTFVCPSNNASAKADKLFECVWPFCGLALKELTTNSGQKVGLLSETKLGLYIKQRKYQISCFCWKSITNYQYNVILAQNICLCKHWKKGKTILILDWTNISLKLGKTCLFQ